MTHRPDPSCPAARAPRGASPRRASLLLALLLALLLLAAAGPARARPAPLDPGQPGFATEVMRRIDDLYRGQSSQGVMSMRVKTRHWTRSLKMEHWSLGRDHSLVRILEPRKERGTATLKARRDLFIYLSKTGRTIKISSGMMGGSWMGSHFTNDDLVRNSRLSRDYTVKLVGRGEEGGQRVYRFDCKARPDAPTVWDRLEVTVRQSDLLPLRQVFFDEQGRKVRVLVFSDYRALGGRQRPTTMTMRPQDTPDESTEVRFEKVDYGVKLEPGFFSLQRLRALR